MIREALNDFAVRNARVFEGRERTVGASEVGTCMRRTFYVKRGGERDSEHTNSWGATARATVFENHFWIPALRAQFGERLLFAGEQQETFALGLLSSTPDGLIVALDSDVLAPLGVDDIGGDGSLVVECKTIDPRAKLDGPRLDHALQAQAQLGLLHALTSHRPEYALISYTDASSWDRIHEFPIRRDPVVFANTQKRAAAIMSARSAEELAPEGWVGGGGECCYCPFTRACGRARTAVPDTDNVADPQFVAEVRDLALAYEAHRGEVDAATSKVRELQNEIRERLRTKGLRRAAGDDFSIMWSPVKGRQGTNTKALAAAAAAAGIDVTQFETVGDPTDRLTISVQNSEALTRGSGPTPAAATAAGGMYERLEV